MDRSHEKSLMPKMSEPVERRLVGAPALAGPDGVAPSGNTPSCVGMCGNDLACWQACKAAGGWFITTAACSALGKGDGCNELMTRRWYRDNVLAHREGGA